MIEGYSEKYARVVAEGAGWGEAGGWGAKEIEGEVRAEIVRLYAEVEGGGVEGREEEVVLLDYLITLKQLLALNAGNDLDYFHRKSKIEAIVEGRPAKTITPDHLAAIVHKLRLFHVI